MYFQALTYDLFSSFCTGKFVHGIIRSPSYDAGNTCLKIIIILNQFDICLPIFSRSDCRLMITGVTPFFDFGLICIRNDSGAFWSYWKLLVSMPQKNLPNTASEYRLNIRFCTEIVKKLSSYGL